MYYIFFIIFLYNINYKSEYFKNKENYLKYDHIIFFKNKRFVMTIIS